MIKNTLKHLIKSIFALFLLLIILLCLPLTVNAESTGVVIKEKIATKPLNFISHRGYSATAPENTIPAFEQSKEMGYKFVEADISFTKDNIPVLLHDNTISRTSNGTGKISDLTYEQLLKYDFGSWKSSDYKGLKITTFEEFISLCKDLDLWPYIELKTNGKYTEEQIKILLDIVSEYEIENKVTYISFSAKFLEMIKEQNDSARLGYLVRDVSHETIKTINNLQTEYNNVFVDVKYQSLSASKIKLCKENNIPLEVWTINSKKEVNNLDKYISGITTDKLI